MTVQILLNLLIAMVWMMLHDVWNTLMFAIGYLLGFLIIYSLRRFFPGRFYGIKLWAIIKLLYLFSIELITSSIIVIGQIMRPKINIKPGIFKTTTRLKSEWEVTMLSNLLTLTPGSVVLEIDKDEGALYIHAMDVAEFEEATIRTKNRFEEVIMEVMR